MKNKLETPFTEDQVNYLEDRLTSIMTQFALEERFHRKLKLKILEVLREVKKNT